MDKSKTEDELLERLRKAITGRKLESNQKVITFLFFVLLSSTFWLLNALNKTYTTSIPYPVHYVNFPENKILIGDIPQRLSLDVEAHGYTLLKYKLSSRKIPIIFNVKSFSLNRIPGENQNRFYILTQFAREKIARQLSSEITINDINPDTLYFNFAELVSKRIPVNAIIEVEFARQYMVQGRISTTPDSLTVTGPDVILDTLSYIDTKPLKLEKVSHSTQRNLSLQAIENLEYSDKRVVVNIPVERFTQASLLVPVNAINVPDSLGLKTFPSKVNVSYIVGLSSFNLVDENAFEIVVDYNQLQNNLNNKLRVEVIRSPVFVRSVTVHPLYVDYVIEKQ